MGRSGDFLLITQLVRVKPVQNPDRSQITDRSTHLTGCPSVKQSRKAPELEKHQENSITSLLTKERGWNPGKVTWENVVPLWALVGNQVCSPPALHTLPYQLESNKTLCLQAAPSLLSRRRTRESWVSQGKGLGGSSDTTRLRRAWKLPGGTHLQFHGPQGATVSI